MSAGETPARIPDPYLGMRFRVDIDSVAVAGFSEVSGLEAEIETEEYEEGGVNTHVHRIPTRVTYGDLTLKRGVADHNLWAWVADTAATVDISRQAGDERPRLTAQRRNVTVVSCDPTGADVCRWSVRAAYPVRWEGPQFQADQGSVAVETLELTHKGLSRDGP